MNEVTKKYREAVDAINSIIREFEKETEMVITGPIDISRDGCSGSPPYRVFGVSFSFTPNDRLP